MSDQSSQESSFDDSGIFTQPSMDKFLIRQEILRHWRRKARIALVLNLVYATAWIVVDFLFLCKKVVHLGGSSNYKTVTEASTEAGCDWHGIVAPCLLLFASLLGNCVIFSVKTQDIGVGTENKLKVAKFFSQLAFAVVLIAALWTQVNIIVRANDFSTRKVETSPGIYTSVRATSTTPGSLSLVYKHDPILLYLEFGLSFFAVLVSLAMAVAMNMLARAVHNFANLEKLMGQFVSRISPHLDE